MEYPELVQSASDLWAQFISVDGFGWFVGFIVFAAFVVGFFFCFLFVLISDLYDVIHAAVPLVKRFFKDRKAKKSGKLTNEQRLELLEEKIDSLADIVISTSEEVK